MKCGNKLITLKHYIIVNRLMQVDINIECFIWRIIDLKDEKTLN